MSLYKYFVFAPDFALTHGTYIERVSWLKENMTEQWYYDPLEEGYFFDSNDDAMMFKMRWGESREHYAVHIYEDPDFYSKRKSLPEDKNNDDY